MIVKTYGYVRVSSKDQNEARQVRALNKANVEIEDIFIDKLSGKDFDRPEYKKLLSTVRRGDLIVIKSIDRLGRNYNEVLEQWRILTKKKGVDVYVIDMPLLDTRQKRDLLGSFIADVVLQVLSFVAEEERKNIKTRQSEGIAAAKARGVRFGRVPDPLPANFDVVVTSWWRREISLNKAAKMCGMATTTFYNKALENAKNRLEAISLML